MNKQLELFPTKGHGLGLPCNIGLGLTCNTCDHRQRWECNSKTIQYCGARKSNRTENGLLKIKCKNPACSLYKPCT